MSLELKNKAFFIELQELGVCKIVYEYSGGGDSGAIDEILLYDDNDDKLDLLKFSKYKRVIEDLGYFILQDLYSYDWYNDNGGQGELIINLVDKTYIVNGTTNYIAEEEAVESGDIDDIFSILEKTGTSLLP